MNNVKTLSILFSVCLLFAACSKNKDVCVSSTENVTCYNSLPDSNGSCPAGTTKTSVPNSIKECISAFKPVIYLYPESETDVSVKLNFHGQLTATYPEYDPSLGGWDVTAHPNGKIINKADQKEYSYLFWDGKADDLTADFSTGFVVSGSETRAFLQSVLPKMGLEPKEYNEFIVFWYPLMKNNPYNLIHFEGEAYEKSAPLEITPTPDSILRVFMMYRPLTEKIQVEPQSFAPFNRKGFSVIEWGGTMIP